MPLSAAKSPLESAIEAAFKLVKTSGEADDADPDAIIAQLATDLTTAIHDYTTSALVITDAGQMVATAVVTAGSPSAQAGTGTGATSASGTGSLT
jgi:hypothetical protein